MDFKLGDTLICVKSQIKWWTEGVEYEVKLEGGEPVLFDDEGDSWGVDFLLCWNDDRTELQFEKVEEEKRNEI